MVGRREKQWPDELHYDRHSNPFGDRPAQSELIAIFAEVMDKSSRGRGGVGLNLLLGFVGH